MSPPKHRRPEDENGKCTPHCGFLCSLEGVIKIIEFFTVIIACILCIFAERYVDHLVSTRYIIFLIIGIICWIFVIFVILWNMFCCFNKCLKNEMRRLNAWYLFLLAYSLSWFFFWFGAAFLLIWHYNFWSGTAAAAFFGFINTVLFFVDSIMYYRKCRKYRIPLRKRKRGLLEEESEKV